jgi:hypothetical protein
VGAGKTLVMTEEDRGTFSAKVRRFGITSTGLVAAYAPETRDDRFGQEAWPALVDEAARKAEGRGCDTLCWDTLTTWAPWAFRSPEHMSFCLRTVKQACVRHRLAGVVIPHNRKQRSDLGAVVDMLGTIAGSAAYDVVAGIRRDKQSGECTLAVDGRLGEWTCTAPQGWPVRARAGTHSRRRRRRRDGGRRGPLGGTRRLVGWRPWAAGHPSARARDAVIGEFLALALGPEGVGRFAHSNGIFPGQTFAVWKALPGLLINVMAASLLLGERLPAPGKIWGIAGPHVIMAGITSAGQFAVAGLLVLVLLGPAFGFSDKGGALIELSFRRGSGH